MKTLYEPSSPVEGHMLQELLRQEGIPSQLDGAFLQGAVGGLPTSGLVRLLVDELDYEKGRIVIDLWESTESEPAPVSKTRPSGRLLTLFVGLTIGIASTYAFLRSPVSVDGIDHNRDGVLDEQWVISPSGATVGVRVDRNLDGKSDYVIHYDQRGQIETSEGDDDFDGKFESHFRYRFGNIEVSEVDTNNDGFPDMRSYFKHGVLMTTKYVNPKTGLPLRIESFYLGRVITAEVDTDVSDSLDKRYTYSVSGEISKTEDITTFK